MGMPARFRNSAECFFIAVLAISPFSLALADVSSHPFDQKFSFSAGAFVTDHDTNIRLDSDVGIGTVVNLEDDLGLDATTNIFRAEAVWRFAERHKAHFGVFDLSQTGRRTLDRDLIIDGETYSVGEAVLTDWKMQLIEVGYSYRIRGNERTQWWFDVAFFIQDTAIVVQETAFGGDVSSEDVVLPLPKFGVGVDHAFSDRWIGHAGIDLFKLEVGDVGGSLVDLRATLDYRFTDNFSIGAGWHLINVTVDLNKPVSGWQGRFDWETRGLMLFGRLVW
jgi:hypothetical protein